MASPRLISQGFHPNGIPECPIDRELPTAAMAEFPELHHIARLKLENDGARFAAAMIEDVVAHVGLRLTGLFNFGHRVLAFSILSLGRFASCASR